MAKSDKLPAENAGPQTSLENEQRLDYAPGTSPDAAPVANGEIAELRAKVDELSNALDGALSLLKQANPVGATKADAVDPILKLEERSRQHEEYLERINADLEAGKHKFTVSLHGNPSRDVGVGLDAKSGGDALAIEKYRKFYGIINSEHTFHVAAA